MNRFQNCGAVVGDSDGPLGGGVANALENFVHALGSQRGLDQVSHGNSADERLHSRQFTSILGRALVEDLR